LLWVKLSNLTALKEWEKKSKEYKESEYGPDIFCSLLVSEHKLPNHMTFDVWAGTGRYKSET
jgi:hypothetical protein